MPDYLEQYNLVWDAPSRNAGESMPCGGHDIGLNVWVEADPPPGDGDTGDGDLLFYIDRAGSFDENNQMLKLGRVRLRMTPNPFAAGLPFRQELKLRQGRVEIVAGEPAVQIVVWVESERPVSHVEVAAGERVTTGASYETWALAPRVGAYGRRHTGARWVRWHWVRS